LIINAQNFLYKILANVHALMHFMISVLIEVTIASFEGQKRFQLKFSAQIFAITKWLEFRKPIRMLHSDWLTKVTWQFFIIRNTMELFSRRRYDTTIVLPLSTKS